MLEGALFVLAVWWLGGLWVAIGLVALLEGTAPVRRHHHQTAAVTA